MRGFKAEHTAENLSEGFRVYYNFIRKHNGIDKTPAQASGIELELERNRWLSLLKKSISTK